MEDQLKLQQNIELPLDGVSHRKIVPIQNIKIGENQKLDIRKNKENSGIIKNWEKVKIEKKVKIGGKN